MTMEMAPHTWGHTSNVLMKGSVVPSLNVYFDLGSPTERWRDLYISANTLNVGGTAVSRDEETGGVIITDTLAQTQSSTLKVQTLTTASGDIINLSGSTLSNLAMTVDQVKAVVPPQPTFGSNEVYIENNASAPGLYINQSGACNIIEFHDDGVPVVKVLDGGAVLITPQTSSHELPALDVYGAAVFRGGMNVNGKQISSNIGVQNTQQMVITNDGTGPALIVNQQGAQPILEIQDDGVPVFHIEDGGNIGIGTTNPSYKMHVVGTTCAASGFISYSDASLKTNIEDIADAVNLTTQLRGVRYNRVDEDTNTRKVGMIAQEVEAVLPEVVKTDSNGMKSLAYEEVVALLVQAVKEQQTQIDALKACSRFQ